MVLVLFICPIFMSMIVVMFTEFVVAVLVVDSNFMGLSWISLWSFFHVVLGFPGGHHSMLFLWWCYCWFCFVVVDIVYYYSCGHNLLCLYVFFFFWFFCQYPAVDLGGSPALHCLPLWLSLPGLSWLGLSSFF